MNDELNDHKPEASGFEVSYETPEQFKELSIDLVSKLKSAIAFGVDMPLDTDTCLKYATCLRVSSAAKYRNEEFVDLFKQKSEQIKNRKGPDFESRVAYYLLGTVADREYGEWKRGFTSEEAYARSDVADGAEVPQGTEEDKYGLGEIPSELVDYAKKVLLEHLATTESVWDVKDVVSLLVRVYEYADEEIESESSFLRMADCGELIELIEKRREDLILGGKEMSDELLRFDGIKKVIDSVNKKSPTQ